MRLWVFLLCMHVYMCTCCSWRCVVWMDVCVLWMLCTWFFYFTRAQWWFLWSIFICGLHCMYLLLFVSHSKQTRYWTFIIWLYVISGLQYVCIFIYCLSFRVISCVIVSFSPNACLEASAMHLMHLTSFPCPALHRWRLATHSIPLRSVFFP